VAQGGPNLTVRICTHATMRGNANAATIMIEEKGADLTHTHQYRSRTAP
jgi:hypothetical protein